MSVISFATSRETANTVAVNGAQAGEPPDPYWRSLYFFNGYRFVIAVLLLSVVTVFGRDIMFGADHFHPSETGYANMVSVLIPAVTASLREKEVSAAYAYAGHPRDLMSVADAAAEASQHAGTQVVQQGRWATVLRRRHW